MSIMSDPMKTGIIPKPEIDYLRDPASKNHPAVIIILNSINVERESVRSRFATTTKPIYCFTHAKVSYHLVDARAADGQAIDADRRPPPRWTGEAKIADDQCLAEAGHTLLGRK